MSIQLTRPKMTLCFATLILIAALFAQSAHGSSPTTFAVNDSQEGLVINAKDQNGLPVQYTYSKDRFLLHALIGTIGITYSYSGPNLLAYAITDHGAVYAVLRDRENRISQIVGANSTQMVVTYLGGSTVPSRITVTTASGQTVTPYDHFSSANSFTYSIQSIDQSLSVIYEAYAFFGCSTATLEQRN